jgi:voltage-gated potassium channel
MFGFGTIVFIHYQHLDPLTAFLGSVSTITTIGIYAPNIVGMTASEQILLIITFIVSVGLAASIVQSTITTAMNKDILREQLVRKKIGRLEGHVIVAGYSYLGKYVTEWLEHLNVGHAVISRDPISGKTVRSAGLLAIHAPTTRSYESLKESGVERASTLVCAFDDDADNLLVAMNARKMNKDIRILMTVQDRDLVDSTMASDIDFVLPVFDILAKLLAMSAVAEEISGVFLTETRVKSELANGEQELTPYISEFKVEKGKGAGKKFADLNKVSPILMIVRNGKVIPNAADDFELEIGDRLLVLSSSNESIERLRNVLCSSSTKPKSEMPESTTVHF